MNANVHFLRFYPFNTSTDLMRKSINQITTAGVAREVDSCSSKYSMVDCRYLSFALKQSWAASISFQQTFNTSSLACPKQEGMHKPHEKKKRKKKVEQMAREMI